VPHEQRAGCGGDESAIPPIVGDGGAGALSDRLAGLRRDRNAGGFRCELGSSVLGFGSAAFVGVATRDLYAQQVPRAPDGRGAHFDVYADLVDQSFPWGAVFNLAGDAVVSSSRFRACS
jgi:hypothetical protein